VNRGGDPLDRLLHVVEQASGDDVRATTFVRGLALGALVGAAIAGSTIWQRRRHPGSGTETEKGPPPTSR
jgi:hypothetical protein